MKKLDINKDYLFFAFVGVVSGIFIMIAGSSLLAAFISGIFIFYYLRLMHFIFKVIHKLIGKRFTDV